MDVKGTIVMVEDDDTGPDLARGLARLGLTVAQSPAPPDEFLMEVAVRDEPDLKALLNFCNRTLILPAPDIFLPPSTRHA